MRPGSFLVLISVSLAAGGQTAPVVPAGPPAATLTREEAVSLALANAGEFQLAQVDEFIAAGDLRQARANLLPALGTTGLLTYNSPGPGRSQPSFLGANAIREYQSLVTMSETLSVPLAATVNGRERAWQRHGQARS